MLVTRCDDTFIFSLAHPSCCYDQLGPRIGFLAQVGTKPYSHEEPQLPGGSPITVGLFWMENSTTTDYRLAGWTGLTLCLKESTNSATLSRNLTRDDRQVGVCHALQFSFSIVGPLLAGHIQVGSNPFVGLNGLVAPCVFLLTF